MMRLKLELFEWKADEKGYGQEYGRRDILELVTEYETRAVFVDILKAYLNLEEPPSAN